MLNFEAFIVLLNTHACVYIYIFMELEITKQKFDSITRKSKDVQEMTRKVENLCCPFILFF